MSKIAHWGTSDRGKQKERGHDSRGWHQILLGVILPPAGMALNILSFSLTFKSCKFVTGITVVNVFTDGS